MSASINFVPQACLVARQRIARRNRWGIVAVVCAMTLACGGLVRYSAGHALDHARDRLAHLQARQADQDRQLGVVLRSRGVLFEQARALASLRQAQPLPEQLVALAAETPDEVTLIDLRAQAPVVAVSDAARAKLSVPAQGASAGGSPAPASRPTVDLMRTIHISGYALSHDHLTQWIEAMRRVQHWQQIELLRAAREPLGAGQAIAFRVECHERSVAP